LSIRGLLFDRAKRTPTWLRKPLRAAWYGSKRLNVVLSALRNVPRSLTRPRVAMRILGIYHLQEHAGYLGDMIDFLEILNVLRVQHGFDRIDMCYIDDSSNPNQPISRPRLEASPDYKEMMLSLRAVLPAVGGVHLFDADAEFERFFRMNYRRYVCWPRYGYLHTWPSYTDYALLYDHGHPFANVYTPIDEYFAARGSLPKLSCPPALLDWARAFVRAHVSPALPIALQIRFNPDSPLRDTVLEAWKTFLQRMQSRSDVKFVILCRREEIVPELRQLSNVVYSKDHATGVLNDLALLQVSHLSLMPDSGFVTYPWFCGLPTVYFGKQLHEFPERRYKNERGQGLKFLTRFQRRRIGAYDADTLQRECDSLFGELAGAGWRNPNL
jgi:hypothetical protein